MQKVTLEAISQGKSGTNKNGKPYQMIGLKTKELGDVWINGFGNQTTQGWKQGQVVSIEIYDEEYNGKTYKKFKSPNASDGLAERVDKLEKQMAYIAKLNGIKDTQVLPNPVQPKPTSHNQGNVSQDPFDEIDLNDDSSVPF